MGGIKKYLKRRLEKLSPSLYVNVALLYLKLRNKSIDRIATKKSDICIEGFPRSSNSFTARAFRIASSKESLNIATHMHSHANILRAIKLGVPTLVLIRKPKDAVISLRALTFEKAYRENSNIEIDFNDFESDLRWYIIFYKSLISRRNSFVIGDFDEIITDFNIVVSKFNNKFNSDFKVLDNIEELVKNKSNNIGGHVFPTQIRNEIKRKVKSGFESKLKKREISQLLEEANMLYAEFVDY